LKYFTAIFDFKKGGFMSNIERAFLYSITAIALLVSVWAKLSIPKSNEVFATNSSGTVVGKLGTTTDGNGCLVLYDKEGRVTTSMARGSLRLRYDDIERIFLGKSEGPDGVGTLVLYGSKTDAARVSLFANDMGQGALYLGDQKGQTVAGMGGKPSGGYVTVYGPKSEPLASMCGIDFPSALKPSGGLITFGSTGSSIAALGISDIGNGCLTLWDSNANLIDSLPKNSSARPGPGPKRNP
jgi:hypothetical protein